MWWFVKSVMWGIVGGKIFDVIEGYKKWKYFDDLKKRKKMYERRDEFEKRLKEKREEWKNKTI